ncbi:MAG: hypothetical protein LC775_13820, partial [Acidobacteria bacterium]|nr:hypothetical protein [Acidobacteriota bacterium]
MSWDFYSIKVSTMSWDFCVHDVMGLNTYPLTKPSDATLQHRVHLKLSTGHDRLLLRGGVLA